MMSSSVPTPPVDPPILVQAVSNPSLEASRMEDRRKEEVEYLEKVRRLQSRYVPATNARRQKREREDRFEIRQHL